MFIVLLPVIPAQALAVYTNFEQRTVERQRAQEGAVGVIKKPVSGRS